MLAERSDGLQAEDQGAALFIRCISGEAPEALSPSALLSLTAAAQLYAADAMLLELPLLLEPACASLEAEEACHICLPRNAPFAICSGLAGRCAAVPVTRQHDRLALQGLLRLA